MSYCVEDPDSWRSRVALGELHPPRAYRCAATNSESSQRGHAVIRIQIERDRQRERESTYLASHGKSMRCHPKWTRIQYGPLPLMPLCHRRSLKTPLWSVRAPRDSLLKAETVGSCQLVNGYTRSVNTWSSPTSWFSTLRHIEIWQCTFPIFSRSKKQLCAVLNVFGNSAPMVATCCVDYAWHNVWPIHAYSIALQSSMRSWTKAASDLSIAPLDDEHGTVVPYFHGICETKWNRNTSLSPNMSTPSRTWIHADSNQIHLNPVLVYGLLCISPHLILAWE